LGDGGALTAADDALAARARRIRNGGQTDRYHHGEFGVNSRLDEIQAAVLRARLPLLAGWTERRRTIAGHYRRALAGASTVLVPAEADPGHVYHLFPVRSVLRTAMQAHLRANGVETLVHYPVPIPHQPALAGERPADCPVANRLCAEVFSLPLYPSLPDAAIRQVVDALASGPSSTDTVHERHAQR
jgi:dTDP-4-amino-4,6-dideoxygalactose transaminase